jgi:hypothetical protein
MDVNRPGAEVQVGKPDCLMFGQNGRSCRRGRRAEKDCEQSFGNGTILRSFLETVTPIHAQLDKLDEMN